MQKRFKAIIKLYMKNRRTNTLQMALENKFYNIVCIKSVHGSSDSICLNFFHSLT